MAVAAAAAVLSPRVRHVLQRGVVFSLATVFSLGGRLAAGLNGVVQAAQPAAKDEGLEDISARR